MESASPLADADPSKVNDPLHADRLLLGVILTKIRRGLPQTFGLGLIGLVVAIIIGLIAFWMLPRQSTARVTFAFAGFERGKYPDGSAFIAEDLRAPDVVAAALSKHKDLVGKDQTQVRSSIAITGIISPNIIKERDRIRASGQIPPPYFPDEYEISINSPRNDGLNARQQETLLQDVVSAYMEKFRRTYVEMPPQFGKAFDNLSGSDYFEYELILNQDMQTMETFLRTLTNDQTDDRTKTTNSAAITFRSKNTGYSFNELLGQTRNFAQLKLTEVMGLIQSTGLSKNRQTALVKMDYRIRILSEEEKRLADEEAMIRDLMGRVEQRNQSYVLGIKSQAGARTTDSPLIDQGLLDTLVQNDSLNYLVRRAVDAGIRVREVAAQKNELVERSERMRKFLDKAEVVQAGAQQSVDEALQTLRAEYKQLIGLVTRTYEDYTQQELGTAVRMTQSPHSEKLVSRVIPFALAGLFIGLILGLGLSLVSSER